MADMTLKELRDSIRGWEAQSHADRHKYAECRDSPSEGAFSDWADAIDAHLAGMGEPVAWRVDWPTWRQYHDLDANPLPNSWESPPPRVTPLYTAPPASADVASLQSRLAAADALLREAIGWNWLDDGAPRPDVMDVLDQKIQAHLQGAGDGR